jgi:sRNA-binding protein
MSLSELVETLEEGAHRIDIDGTPSQVGPTPDELREAASQLLAMKGALEEARAAIQAERDCVVECATLAPEHDLATLDEITRPHVEEYDRLLAKIAALLTTSAADKIAEGLRDAIAIAKGGSPNSGGGDA